MNFSKRSIKLFLVSISFSIAVAPLSVHGMPRSEKFWNDGYNHGYIGGYNDAATNLTNGLAGLVVGCGLIIACQWYLTHGNSLGKGSAAKGFERPITTFADVAGAYEAKAELQDVVDFLKDPAPFARLGAKPPKGILLVGGPGNGKTLLAKAVAGEANCSFFSVSGSDFIEMYVGVGAARVRKLFADARAAAPSIIFIDEIDAVGKKRSGMGGSGGDLEHVQTVTQLLAEMDGFSYDPKRPPVIVIAATNNPESLDEALVRPGRFDRKVEVPLPALQDRAEILKVHMRGIKVDESVDVQLLARATTGFSGAELAELVNQAAAYATKEVGQMSVKQKHFDEARDTIAMGRSTKSKAMSVDERSVTAYHEAGHALVNMLLADTPPLYKITIKPRGFSLGSTHFVPLEDSYSKTREQMISTIKVLLGGRAAELLTFGKLTTGAGSDMQKATVLAHQMVCQYGMSDHMGPLVYDPTRVRYAEATLQGIDEAVKNIILQANQNVLDTLKAHKEQLEKLAQALLSEETLDASQAHAITAIPVPMAHK